MGVNGPYNAQYHGDKPGHAEAEHHPGNDEFVSSMAVDLEDSHMRCSADHEEYQKNGTYGDINADCW